MTPLSAISEDSSGGVCSKATLMAPMIAANGSLKASRVWALVIINSVGSPEATPLPTYLASLIALDLKAEPTSSLIFSAVTSPIIT